MALSEFEIKQIERSTAGFVERRRPPVEVRSQVDLAYRITGQSLELFELRAPWDGSGEMIELPIAKATYVKRSGIWKVYWQRADLKWHRYGPRPEVDSIDAFLAVVEQDEFGCFFG